jgi:hypothetical protein
MAGDYPDRDAQLFYELARDRHASQAALLDSLDSKLGVFLSASGALMGILIAVYAIRPDAFSVAELVVVTGSGCAWITLSVWALHALWRQRWRSGPDLQFVFDLHFSEEDQRLKWRVANTYWHDYRRNELHAGRKGLALTWITRLFAAQTALLVVALLFVGSRGS